MTGIIDFQRLERFLENASAESAHRCAVALQAAASAAELTAVELQTRAADWPVVGEGAASSAPRRHHRKRMT